MKIRWYNLNRGDGTIRNPYRTTTCDSAYVSSGISSCLSFGSCWVLANFALWKLEPAIEGWVSVHGFCCESAAFFSDSIMREIITGRYLKEAGLSNEIQAKGRAYTGRPLIVVMERFYENSCALGN